VDPEEDSVEEVPVHLPEVDSVEEEEEVHFNKNFNTCQFLVLPRDPIKNVVKRGRTRNTLYTQVHLEFLCGLDL
jgi:hypothetical protein